MDILGAISEYIIKYSEVDLWDKIKEYAKKAGVQVIYMVLLLFYAMQSPSVPTKVKAIITGALGYFISPIDIISDFIPVVGYTDDAGVLLAALLAVAFFIDDECKQKARNQIKEWFGEDCLDELLEIDKKIDERKKADPVI